MVHWQQFGERFRYSRESLLQFDDEQTELLKFVGLVSAVSDLASFPPPSSRIIHTKTQARLVSVQDLWLCSVLKLWFAFVAFFLQVSFSIFLTLRFVIFRKYSSDFSNRLVSILHGIFALTYSTYLMNWSAPFAEVGRATHPIEVSTFSFPFPAPLVSKSDPCFFFCFSGGGKFLSGQGSGLQSWLLHIRLFRLPRD